MVCLIDLIGFIILSFVIVWDLYVILLFTASLFYTDLPYKAKTDVSILLLIPAHNEESVIETTLRKLAGATARVVVIADHCKDRTAFLARQMGVEVFEFKLGETSTKGKALAAALDFYKATPWDYMMVIDADNIVPHGSWGLLPFVLKERPDVLQMEVRPGNPEKSFNTKMITVLYGFLNRVVQRGRAVLGLNAFLCGTGMLFRRDIILCRAPWDENAGLVEDLRYQIELSQKGIRVKWIDSVWIDDEKPFQFKSGVVQGSRWLRGRWNIVLELIKNLSVNPLSSISNFWQLLPKPVFLFSFIGVVINLFTQFISWSYLIPVMILPYIFWTLPAFLYRPYNVGIVTLFFPVWQIASQALNLLQAVIDRGKGWRHTKHFGQ